MHHPHIEALCQFDTCTLSNAIEEFGLRLHNEGYTLPGLHCVTGATSTIAGFAATCQVKAADPTIMHGQYFERTDWWEAIQSMPAPRIAVIQDTDTGPIPGACVGEVHAAILKALGCQGVITDGAVRNLPSARQMGFRMFALHVAVSHGYLHVVRFGGEVEIFGLKIRSGDLLCADCHGVINIPLEILEELPAAAARVHARRRKVVDLCLSPDFTTAKLRAALEEGKS